MSSTIPPEFKSGFAPSRDLDIYYEVYGNGGTPLVLLHGGGSTIGTSFSVLIPYFSKTRTVVGIEFQAHGHTKDRGVPTTFERDADDAAAVIQHLKIPKADVLGFSNGGSSAMQLAIRHPSLVNKLVPVSATSKREGLFPGFFDMMKGASLANMPMPLQDAFLKINPDRAALETMHARDRDRMLAFEDWDDALLRSIRQPTLFMCGDHDVITIEHTVAMMRLVERSSLCVLPGNHGDFMGEICTDNTGSRMPEYMAGIVQEFLDR